MIGLIVMKWGDDFLMLPVISSQGKKIYVEKMGQEVAKTCGLPLDHIFFIPEKHQLFDEYFPSALGFTHVYGNCMYGEGVEGMDD